MNGVQTGNCEICAQAIRIQSFYRGYRARRRAQQLRPPDVGKAILHMWARHEDRIDTLFDKFKQRLLSLQAS